jgi:hypothetical protein
MGPKLHLFVGSAPEDEKNIQKSQCIIKNWQNWIVLQAGR